MTDMYRRQKALWTDENETRKSFERLKARFDKVDKDRKHFRQTKMSQRK